MRRLLTWLLVTLGVAALVRRLRRRGGQAEVWTPRDEGDPAEELRRKLAESRSEDEVAAADTAGAEQSSVEERRAEVHDQGRSTLDEMRGPDEN
jgi:hypothetical protein